MHASQKVAQYLGEAKATEGALVRVLQSQIAMTPDGTYRQGLEKHLEETRDHSRRLGQRIREISGTRNPLGLLVGFAGSAAGQTLALAKTPLDLLRGAGGEEKVLKNAKDAAATESLEIATYTAIERLARSVGDDTTVKLAQRIRADEERMLARIMREIPVLTDAVVRAQLKDDPSYDVTRTGAADTARTVGKRARSATKRAAGDARSTTRRAGRQARKVPGVAQAEGEIKGAVADAGDLPISGYDAKTADEITASLPGLSQVNLAKVDGYERRHDNRKTILDRIETLRGEEPWLGYDELSVGEIETALRTRGEDTVNAVRAYEAAHKNRTGVIKVTDQQLAGTT